MPKKCNPHQPRATCAGHNLRWKESCTCSGVSSRWSSNAPIGAYSCTCQHNTSANKATESRQGTRNRTVKNLRNSLPISMIQNIRTTLKGSYISLRKCKE